MSKGSAIEHALRDFDLCACGDYRLQHDDYGCLVCRAGRSPWDGCDGFDLDQEATEVPEFYQRREGGA